MTWVINEFVTAIMIASFGGVSIWAFTSKAPVNFWAGDEVKTAEISDIRAFNRGNGLIWAFLTLPQLIAAVLHPINGLAANIFQVGGIVIGIPIAIAAYKIIEKKYRKKGKIQ
ncbi:MAG: major capsid protein [Firmicutes bacterium]|nr:major capsid protein [[Eubacterium] siraeum]MCM1486759.1 major capsid protein [Bacillota bacterium]